MFKMIILGLILVLAAFVYGRELWQWIKSKQKGEEMANMSYCRFENTAGDLRDCVEHMEDKLDSRSEIHARRRIVEMAMSIVEEFGGVRLNEAIGDDDDES